MIRRRHVPPSVGRAEISPEVAKLSRRRLLRNGLSLGSLALLTGCDLSTHSGIDAALWAMLRFDDRVQSALYNPQRLPKPIRRARSPDRSASTLTIQFGRSARSQKIGALPSPGWLRNRAEFQNPAPHRLIGDIETAFGEELFHVAVAQGEPEIKPNRMLDDRW